jgi:hypothetical protein
MAVAIAFDRDPVQGLAFRGIYLLAKTRISSTELIWMFRERLSSFDDCTPSMAIAIVPSAAGWTALTTRRDRASRPDCVKRIEQIQKRLRGVYALSKD